MSFCSTTPIAPTWIQTGVDGQLSSWWVSQASQPGVNFANRLASTYGNHATGFQCGIGLQGTCSIGGCSDYQNDPDWAYLAVLSTVNLNDFMNRIYTGTINGQANFVGRVDELGPLFFPEKNPQFAYGDAQIWLSAGLASIAAMVAPELYILYKIGIGAGLAFSSAGLQQVSASLQPNGTNPNGFLSLGELKDQMTGWQMQLRELLDVWTNQTMCGVPDGEGHTIVDYMAGGQFVDARLLPTASEIERYWTAQFVAKTINAQWKNKKVFVERIENNDPSRMFCPNETRYYDESEHAEYCTFVYAETGVLRGHLQTPLKLDDLQKNYGISGSDISRSAALSYRLGKFNVTSNATLAYIQNTLPVQGAGSAFADGAAAAGTWTLPVCDTGSQRTTTDFGTSASKYGGGNSSSPFAMLPCCCGSDCSETSDFSEAANMKGFQTLLRGCREQLKGSNVTKFDKVAYGYQWSKKIPYLFWETSLQKRAGITAGVIVGWFVVLVLLFGCCG